MATAQRELGNSARTRLRILHVINTLSIGGAEHYVVNLANALDRKKFEVFVARSDGKNLGVNGEALDAKLHRPAMLLKLHVRRMRGWWDIATFVSYLGTVFAIVKIIKRYDIDVVHTHLMPSALLAWVAAWLCGVPSVYNLMRVFMPLDRFDWLGVRYAFIGQVYSRLVTQYVAFSQYVQDDLEAKMGINRHNIKKIYLGIDIRRYSPGSNDEHKRSLATNVNSIPVIGVIPRLAPGKGVHKALLALPYVLHNIPSARLLIVGDGPLRTQLEELCAKLCIGEHVIFAGFADDTAKVMSEIDLFLQTSDGPNIGIATLEAMAFAKPIITVAQDAKERLMASETLIDGENGFIVENESSQIAAAIVEVLRDKDLAAKMGRASRKIVEEKFDFDDHVVSMQELYERLSMSRRL